MFLLLLACAHAPRPSPATLPEDEEGLRGSCGDGRAEACEALVERLELGAFGPGRTAEAFVVARSRPDLEMAAGAVLLAEDHPDVIAPEQRVEAWKSLCGLGFLPGCEVGARVLQGSHPEVAGELAAAACRDGWSPGCAPAEAPAVVLSEPFASALAAAGGEFRMPPGFHVVPARPRLFAIASDDGRLTVSYMVMDDTAPMADGQWEERLPGLMFSMVATALQVMPGTDFRYAAFPALLVRTEYNANWGATNVLLTAGGQVATIYLHRDPGSSLWMMMQFSDPSVGEDLFPAVGHSVRFAEPIGFSGRW